MIDRPTVDADAPAGTHAVLLVEDSPADVALVLFRRQLNVAPGIRPLRGLAA